MKDKKDRQGDTTESRGVIPLYFLAEIEDRENRKHRQSDDFLNGLELRRAEFVGTNPVGRNLKAVLKKSDAPAHQNHFPQGGTSVLQMAIPRKRHEDIRNREQDDGSHVSPFSLCLKGALDETQKCELAIQTGPALLRMLLQFKNPNDVPAAGVGI
jgi:hypothetical protein